MNLCLRKRWVHLTVTRKRRSSTRSIGGVARTYLHPTPKAKAIQSLNLKIRELTSARQCCIPIPMVIGELNSLLRGWKDYFILGYPYMSYRKIDFYVYGRLIQHLGRRSQRPYKKPKGMTYYQQFKRMGLFRLTGYGK